MCPALVGGERAVEADTRMLPAGTWFSVLVRGVRPGDPVVPAAARECSGREIAAEPPGVAAEPLPPRRLGDGDLTFATGPDGQLLVWARTHHFADGTARGPVALVRWVDRGVEVRGIGTLWAPARRVRLRLEPLADVQVLIADGERCVGDGDCARELQLLPLLHQRFVQAPLHEAGVDGPSGPARIATRERSDHALADGWLRRADVQRHVRVRERRVTIAEDLRVRDCDPAAEPEVCRERLHVRDERPLTWDGEAFTAPPSAWAQVGRP
jgi:hypothetical protein